jgi:hypothetical protein
MRLDDQQVGKAAFVAAVAGTVLAPIAALSRFATEEGKQDLELPGVRVWAEPTAEALSPLLDWGSADTVYLAYGKLWAPILLAAVLCAFAVRRRRTPTGAEKWGWRLTLIGMVGIAVGVTIGGLVLGIGLLRRGFRPRATAVLLILWLPLFFVLSSLIAAGAALLPMLWAFGVAGWSLATAPEEAPEPVRV